MCYDAVDWNCYDVIFFLLAQKEKTRKRHLNCPGSAGFLAILTAGGDANKLGFASDSGVFAYLIVLIRQRLRFSAGQKGD